MFDIALKDLFSKISSKGPFGWTYMNCPHCGYGGVVSTFDPAGGEVAAWPSPADLECHLGTLERLKVFSAADLLNSRPFELLHSSQLPLENLETYVEAGRYWFAVEGDRARTLLAHRGWPDRAIQTISGGMALRLAGLLEGGLKGDRVEVTVQMADVLPLERVIDMEPGERLNLRQDHARRTQGDLTRTLELRDVNYTQIWLANQFVALLNVDQIRGLAANLAVRSVCPTLPFEPCIDEGVKRVSADTLLISKKCTGNGQVVALLDSGVDGSHPDLQSAQIVYKNDYTRKGHVDQHGHGTHLAGVIASGHGQYKGVAPKSTIWSYRVLNEKGEGSSQKELVQALQQAVQDAVNDAKQLTQKIVINCSCAVPRSAGAWGRDYEHLCKAFDDATSDAVVVVAAGNQGPLPRTITAPGGGAAVITVGASVDRPGSPYDFPAQYSSCGPAIHRRSKPDIIAPGGLKNPIGDMHEKVSMISSRIDGVWAQDQSNQKPWLVDPNDPDHCGASGTSQATALVSGICALLLEDLTQRKRQVKHEQVALALKDTALNLGYSGSTQGHGLIRADKAMGWF